MAKKLTKSTKDCKIAGVCAGLAEYLEWDVTLVRILFVLAMFFGLSSGVWIYAILAIVLPKEA